MQDIRQALKECGWLTAVNVGWCVIGIVITIVVNW
jgi:hypothetical protein